jgi:hypothetical protein
MIENVLSNVVKHVKTITYVIQRPKKGHSSDER